MSISASFLWRFLDDVWDLLPTQDRELFQAYWSGQVQVAANLEQKTLEAAMSLEVAEVPVYLTERWERFVMDESACDLFSATDSLELIGVAGTGLPRETAFYHTLQVSNAAGEISASQTIQFYDESVRQLRYDDLVADSVTVNVGTFYFTRNRDFVVNEALGQVYALPNGRLPFDQLATVRYKHKTYTRDLDYTVDEVQNTIARTEDSRIADGETVAVTYTYNTTATIPLEGTLGIVGVSSLTDETKDFSTLLPGRTLTIATGPNAGTYSVNAVLSPTEIQIAEAFPSAQEEVAYSIDAFPHGQRVDSRIASIPVLQDLIDAPENVLVEGVDYVVGDGILATNSAFRMTTLGPTDDRVPAMWAEEVKYNDETPYRNFGVLIDFYRENSEAYKLALQGLWFAFWTGSTPSNLQRGLHILLGLPYARSAGTVTSVVGSTITIVDSRKRTLTYTVPDGLSAVVAAGDTVERFESLSTGVTIEDRNSNPGFVASELGIQGVERFLTSRASRGSSLTDDVRALQLLEHHLFVPRILVSVIQQSINVTELTTFLDNMKPAWTEYVMAFSSEDEESITLEDSSLAAKVTFDLSANVTSNEWNQGISLDQPRISEDAPSNGEILAGGTQATGNFRDTTQDFVAAGVIRGDIVRIYNGIFKGSWVVLKAVSATTLSLDIDDADIVGASGFSYDVFPDERDMGHDAVQLKREHIVFPGTTYSAPSSLSIATDADWKGMAAVEMVNLLLVDLGNTGNEVQAITDADEGLNEIEVANPPGAGAQDHEIASAALTRENSGGTVTHAYAI